ncbi:MAG TPA: COQ9 family protein [Sphingobium sp.]|nr:COQ9 family protein [Sphingobium sp.]
MTTPTPSTGETLDELRLRLAPKVAENAAFDGWSRRALETTAAQMRVDADIVALAFDGGAVAMIDAWFASIDAGMAATFAPDVLAGMKIRQRITALVEARLAIMARQREALRRAQTVLAMPQNVVAATRLGWRAADGIWRAAGDNAADFSHYTKRATLGAIYAATLLVFVNDESEGWADTRAFLARRIDEVMRFEKAKAKMAERAEMRFDPVRFLGRLRYRA